MIAWRKVASVSRTCRSVCASKRCIRAIAFKPCRILSPRLPFSITLPTMAPQIKACVMVSLLALTNEEVVYARHVILDRGISVE